MKGHDCDTPPKSQYDLDDIWSCIICLRSWQLRNLAELAVERPFVYQKTYEKLVEMGHDNPVVWTTRKKLNGKKFFNA